MEQHLDAAKWGAIEVRPAANPVVAGGYAVDAIYVWRPPSRLRDALPNDYCLPLACCSANGGTRILRPLQDPPTFMALCSPPGIALLAANVGLSREQAFSYRAASLFFQQSKRYQGLHSRSYLRGEDLLITRKARIDSESVLPSDRGIDLHGEGKPWNVTRLSLICFTHSETSSP